jgi:5'-3' exonuclease
METVDVFDNVTLLFDFNNLAIRNFFGAKEILEDPNMPNWALWRYNVFNSIYHTLWKVKNTEEIIIAVDDVNSWRKAVYSRYKESRQKNKKESRVDWKELYKNLNILANELKHHMPFKVLKVKSAEADDIIAVLSKSLRNPCIIITRDEDFFQLLRKKTIRIYDPIKQVIYGPDDFENLKEFVMKLIFCGQKKDDIPNIFTPNDWGNTPLTEGKRRPGFGEKKWESVKDDLKGFIQKGHKIKIKDKTLNIDLHKNLKRNRILIDFDKIPLTIQNRIIDCYNNASLPPIENIYKFFEKYQMRSFLEDIHKVESKLQTLYC